MDVEDFVAVCCAKPAIHRFPAALGRRIHAAVRGARRRLRRPRRERVGGRRRPGGELYRRLRALPGYGEEKARIFVAILAKTQGVTPDGMAGGRRRVRRRRAPLGRRHHRPRVAGRVREWKRAQKAAKRDKQDRPLEPAGPTECAASYWKRSWTWSAIPAALSRAATRPGCEPKTVASRSSSCTSSQTSRPSTAPTEREDDEHPQLRQASHPPKTAVPMLRAGFTDVLSTGMVARWIIASVSPTARPPKPTG